MTNHTDPTHNPELEDLSSTPHEDRVWHTSVTCPIASCLIGSTHWHSTARIAYEESANLRAAAAALKAEGLPHAVEVAGDQVTPEFQSASDALPKCPDCGVLLGPVPNCTHRWTISATDTLKPVSLHFDDAGWSFPALQAVDGDLFVDEATYASLIARNAIDGGPGASDYAPKVVGDRRKITGWEVNYDPDPDGPRSYMTSVDLMGNTLPAEIPLRCDDCDAPVFYATGNDEGYYHAVVPAPAECWGVTSWISGAVDDPKHPDYAEWKASHPA